MKARLHPIGILSLAFGFVVAASAGSNAQPARPWVDPPPEAGASTSKPSPVPEADNTMNSIPHTSAQPTRATGAVKDGDESMAPAQPHSEQASSEERKVARSSSQRASAAHRDRQLSREAAARQRQVSQQRNIAAQTATDTRAARVREGLNAGLEVMTLRTIEFPDGRRVQILTRPQPGVVSELLATPE